MKDSPNVILASGSPRRRELLEMAGCRVEVRRPDVDESAQPGEELHAMLLRLARAKAEAVAVDGDVTDRRPVIAADTMVEFDGQPLGKPRDAADATTMLRRMSGRRHRVLTGFVVGTPTGWTEGVVTTEVRLRELSDEAITAYVATGDPLDKAGAYGIQSLGAALVAEVDGSYTNVVGLPLDEVMAALPRE